MTWKITRNKDRRSQLVGQTKHQGHINEPIVNIEPIRCPPDILHMKKRIIAKQLDQVLEWVICQGKTEEFKDELKAKNIKVDVG